jgi:beta-glucosidase
MKARLLFPWLAAAGLLSLGCSPEAGPDGGPTDSGGTTGSGAAQSASGGTGGASSGTGGESGAVGGAGGTIAGGGGGNGAGGTGGTPGGYELPVVAWPSEACASQVSALLSQMSLEQKAAQMVMGQYGDVSSADVSGEVTGTIFAAGSSIVGSSSPADWATLVDGFISASQSTPNGLPILFGVDAVHGNSKATGAVIFPHNIGLGATRNPELVERIGQITAFEMAATGASWTFGPVMSVAHDDHWGRTYESYSEDPADVALLGGAQVVGLQGRGGLGTGAPGVIACAKHFAGDGQATYGTSRKADDGGLVDRADVQIDEATMRTYGIAPYLPAIAAGLGSVMVADTSWNGVNMTGHQQLLTDILKGELGFEGFVTTDWDAVTSGQGGPGVVSAINAGVDMLMAATDWPGQRAEIITAAGSGISQERIDDAVRRVLTVKCEAGLFGWTRDPALLSQVGSEAHRDVGRQAVRESLVLLQHTAGVLPLTKGSNVWVAGSGADALGRQTGGWTIAWQDGGDMTEGTTILEGISAVANVVPTVAEADVAIVVLSEPPYAEWRGDVSSINTLPAEDFTLLSEARTAGKAIVAIVVSGRPVLIADQLANADAWIAAFLPGTEGDGVAEVLFGDHNFSGKLSHSWPQTEDQASLNKDDPGFTPLFPYGHGLSY